MQYVGKFATEDKIQEKTKCTRIQPDPYFNEHGVLKPGFSSHFEIHHFALVALLQWGQESARAREEIFKKHKLRFITNNTIFGYEVKMLVSMMHWDEFNKTFKLIAINNWLKKKETSFKELHEKAELMLKEEERLSTAKFKKGMRYGRKFHAAVCIQEWWLRNHRKYRIYKNIYQLMDKYSVPGGFTGQDSAKYFGIGRSKNLLNIQEDIMKKVEIRRITCRKFATAIRSNTCSAIAANRIKEKRRRGFFAKCEAEMIELGMTPAIYGLGSSARWADHDEPYYCEPCATTDLSYPGGGRASGSLSNPRWAAQCSRCGKKNPFHCKWKKPKDTIQRENAPSPPSISSCDIGPNGTEGPQSDMKNYSFLGRWGRNLGLTK